MEQRCPRRVAHHRQLPEQDVELGGYGILEGSALVALAGAQLARGDAGAAAASATDAMAVQRHTRHRLGLGCAQLLASEALYRGGRAAEAATEQERALKLFSRIGAPAEQHIRDLCLTGPRPG